jgi:phosphoglycolate phosphatase-like HAD superfamily hydrolase
VTTPLPLAIIDLDGVVADVRHRLHHLEVRPKDWDAFFAAAGDDDAHPEGLAIVETLGKDHEIVFLTGRPAHLRGATLEWLDRHRLGGHRLIMRSERDRRPASVVKLELLVDLARERPIGVVVDDDPGVLDAARRAGYPVFVADWEARTAESTRALRDAQGSEGRT